MDAEQNGRDPAGRGLPGLRRPGRDPVPVPRFQGQPVLELLAQLAPAAPRLLGQVSRDQREQAEAGHGRLRCVGGGAKVAVPELRS